MKRINFKEIIHNVSTYVKRNFRRSYGECAIVILCAAMMLCTASVSADSYIIESSDAEVVNTSQKTSSEVQERNALKNNSESIIIQMIEQKEKRNLFDSVMIQSDFAVPEEVVNLKEEAFEDLEKAETAEKIVAVVEPETVEKLAAVEKTETVEELGAVEEPEIVEEPAAVEEPEIAEEPATADESETAEESAEVEEPEIAEELVAVEEPETAEEPAEVEEPEIAEELVAVEESETAEEAADLEEVEALEDITEEEVSLEEACTEEAFDLEESEESEEPEITEEMMTTEITEDISAVSMPENTNDEVQTDTKQSVNTMGLSAEDYDALCRIVEAEAGTEGEQGKLLVAGVIMNRVISPSFPNSVAGVVLQSGQFTPVANGKYYRTMATPETMQAVNRALSGENISMGALYFKSVKSSSNWSNKTLLYNYGNHNFYA